MVMVQFPKLPEIPEGSTQDERQQIFADYKQDLMDLNPRYFNPDGTNKGFLSTVFSLFKTKTAGQ